MLKTRIAFPSFAICSVLYLGISVYLATKGKVIFFSESCFLLCLLVFAGLSKQLRRFIHDWVIFLAAIFLFENLRSAINIFNQIIGNLPRFNYVIIADQWLLQGNTLPELLQKLFPVGTHPQLMAFAALAYALHFFFFLAFGFFIWLKKPESFSRYTIAFILLMFSGLFLYLILPTMPPWLASELGYIPPLDHHNADLTKYFTPSLVKVFMTNPVAAMPSLHAAFPSLCYLVAKHQHKKFAAIFGLYLIAVYFACGYGNAHYLVDLLAGSLLAYLIYLLVYCPKKFKYLPMFCTQRLEKFFEDRDNTFTKCYIALFILFQSQLVFLYSITHTP